LGEVEDLAEDWGEITIGLRPCLAAADMVITIQVEERRWGIRQRDEIESEDSKKTRTPH
jgi:hypothetical protein